MKLRLFSPKIKYLNISFWNVTGCIALWLVDLLHQRRSGTKNKYSFSSFHSWVISFDKLLIEKKPALSQSLSILKLASPQSNRISCSMSLTKMTLFRVLFFLPFFCFFGTLPLHRKCWALSKCSPIFAQKDIFCSLATRSPCIEENPASFPRLRRIALHFRERTAIDTLFTQAVAVRLAVLLHSSLMPAATSVTPRCRHPHPNRQTLIGQTNCVVFVFFSFRLMYFFRISLMVHVREAQRQQNAYDQTKWTSLVQGWSQ